MRLSVLTFNTLGTPFFAPLIKRRYLKAAEIIQDQDIDIVCLQEIFSHYNRMIFDKALSKYPYRIHKKFILGVYGGLAIYSKLPLTFKEFHVYTYPKGLYIPPYTRLAHNGLLVAGLDEIPLTLMTTHFTSDVTHHVAPGCRYYEIIRNQSDQAASVFNRVAKEGDSLLLTGDFNISKNSLLYKEFLKNTTATDLFADVDTPTYAHDRVPYPFPATSKERIDFMFYKAGKAKLKLLQKSHLFEEPATFQNGKTGYLSDHIGLLTKFEL